MRKLAFMTAAIAAGALAGCGGGFSCSDKGKCADDTETIGEALPNCQAIIDGACGGEFKDYGSCILSNETCDAEGDSIDDSSQCTTQYAAAQDCCAHNPAACPSAG